ncbi:ralA-binding protein 1 isoform X2 [Lingula anatina]|uniref:RalA-binding protein 1 isoform X2 n=1 Tax=Lingula anatina TaxID=7574 RepID=A0A1S3HBG3_LINAN|nr:ralA-binding protein 1 isoform X2 [Lingula anatina]|eukprot:XP_013382474.1 ralA-binding protein 1 isoform X2 [Lingula anatina]
MSFESPDKEDFPGLYSTQGRSQEPEQASDDDADKLGKKKDFAKKKDKKEKKDKGYKMFEEDNSEEELMVEDTKSPFKGKRLSKPSFKFAKKEKKEKFKDKEKDKDRDKEKKREERKKLKKLELWKKPKAVETTEADLKPVFGVPLQVACERNKSHDGIQLPVIFRECIDYIEEHGLSCEGIYRISGVKSKIQHLKDNYNKGLPSYLHEHEPNVVASLLKQFLRELPDPVLTTADMPKFEEASMIKQPKQQVERLKKLISELPECNRLLLSWMMVHMTHVIQREKDNKMTLQNVSIVLSPTMKISHRVLNVLFLHWKELFRDVVIKKHVPPLKPATSRWSLELPDDPGQIEDELRKQESVLEQLHKDLKKKSDPGKEEQLWEVQRVVTQLKRKLKHAHKATEAIAASKETKERVSQQQQQQQHQQQKASHVKHKAPQPPQSHQRTDSGDIELKLDLQKPAPVPVAEEPEDKVKTIQKPGVPTKGQEVKEAENDAELKKEVKLSAESIPKTMEVLQESKMEVPKSQERGPQLEAKELKEMPQPSETKEEVKVPEVEEDEAAAHGETPPSEQKTAQDNTEEEEESVELQKSEIALEVKVVSTEKEQMADIPEQVSKEDMDSTPDAEEKTESEVELEQIHGMDNAAFSETTPAQMAVVAPKDITHGNEPKQIQEKGSGLKTETKVVKKVSIKTVQEVPSEKDVAKETKTAPVVAKKTVEVTKPVPAPEDKTDKQKQGGPAAKPAMPLLQPVILHDQKDHSKEIHKRAALEPEEEDLILHVEGSSSGITAQSAYLAEFEAASDDIRELLEEERALQLEEEELLAIGDELRKKIETEQIEIERLQQEIEELEELRQDSAETNDYSSDSDSSSSDSEDEEELQEMLQQLIQENDHLKMRNKEMCQKVHEERQICLEVKVQIRMLQQKTGTYSADALLTLDEMDYTM